MQQEQLREQSVQGLAQGGVAAFWREMLLRWGWLPLASVGAALGLAGVMVAFNTARATGSANEVLFWLGLVCVVGPVAYRLTAPAITRNERLSLLTLLVVALYMVKLLHSPQSFTFYDELLHWRSTNDVLLNDRFFLRNPLLPVSSLFPGLQSSVVAVIELTGLSIYQAGVLVVGLARVAGAVLLYLFYERVANSPFIAGLATLVYITNPNFLFFNGQFAYESLALTFAVLVLYCQVQATRNGVANPRWAVITALAVAAVTATHHLTSYMLVGLLLLWTLEPALRSLLPGVVGWYGGTVAGARLGRMVGIEGRRLVRQFDWRRGARGSGPLPTLLLAASLALLWMIFVAPPVFDYLSSYGLTSAGQFLQLINGELPPRQLFRGFAGEVAPAWEQVAGYASVLLILLCLPFGLLAIYRRYRGRGLATTLAIAALAYPVSQAARFTDLGLQIAGRTVEFLFLPIALVVAVLLVERRWRQRVGSWRGLVTLGMLVLFVGGVVLGWPRWARYPERYLVAADTRSIEAEGLSMATWAYSHLGPNNRIAADRVNGLLLGSYGEQYPVSLAYDKANVPRLFFAPQIDVEELRALREGQLRYLVVDQRLSTQLPISGIYFELGEPNMNRHTRPIPAASLAKFDRFANARLLYDSGNIQIYEVQLP
ncbi:MAG: hypothetical protein MUD01_00970 [Chloroflexaceae bacterium]|jgi:hypothetical protein|nr:hypothetical protein [Chloroflexaceae bacterium]